MKTSLAKAIGLTAAVFSLFAGGVLPVLSKVFATASGTVRSKDGRPIAGARVILIFSEDGSTYELTTDKKGQWRKANLRPGTWTIRFATDGYEPQNVTVNLSAIKDNKPLEIRLTPVPASPLKTGDELYQQEKYAEALQEYQKAFASDADLAEIYEKIGLCYLRLSETERAIENFERVLQIEPRSEEVLVNLSSIYFEKGDLQKGMEYFRQLDERSLRDPALFYNIGVLLFQRHQVDLASEYLKKSLELDPHSINSHYQLGLVSLNKGDLEEAKRSFQKVIDLAPESEKAALARKMVKSLVDKSG